MLLLLGIGLAVTAFVRADEQESSTPAATALRFEEFLRFEGRLPPLNRPAARPAAGCSVRPSYEPVLPELAQWISRLGLSRASQAANPARDETFVLTGTGYNYQRTNRGSGSPGRP